MQIALYSLDYHTPSHRRFPNAQIRPTTPGHDRTKDEAQSPPALDRNAHAPPPTPKNPGPYLSTRIQSPENPPSAPSPEGH
ncbi:hypothetical protein EJ06DRAFT_532811 [Trichodelitschia bisporula]|uniref:Uncharacterized protein n=1 Tax=Trichodelitschia bisporula TaxID=703511 RepID=A0A6G1HP78_9PEZI|nr:hypothetical protein EJ06DRAFT_532811 [Trichodelitschia bisporula]